MSGKKSLKIFIYSADGVGHINACVGLGQAMVNRGHEVYFLCSLMFAGTLKKYGFHEIILTTKQHEDLNINDEDKKIHPITSVKMMLDKFRETGLLSDSRPIEKLECFDSTREDSMGFHMYGATVEIHQQIVDAIQREQPDLIIIDNFIVDPFISFGKIPWAFSWSGNPAFMFFGHPDVPPPCSGMNEFH